MFTDAANEVRKRFGIEARPFLSPLFLAKTLLTLLGLFLCFCVGLVSLSVSVSGLFLRSLSLSLYIDRVSIPYA